MKHFVASVAIALTITGCDGIESITDPGDYEASLSGRVISEQGGFPYTMRVFTGSQPGLVLTRTLTVHRGRNVHDLIVP